VDLEPLHGGSLTDNRSAKGARRAVRRELAAAKAQAIWRTLVEIGGRKIVVICLSSRSTIPTTRMPSWKQDGQDCTTRDDTVSTVSNNGFGRTTLRSKPYGQSTERPLLTMMTQTP
jgi:hypothetical protein